MFIRSNTYGKMRKRDSNVCWIIQFWYRPNQTLPKQQRLKGIFPCRTFCTQLQCSGFSSLTHSLSRFKPAPRRAWPWARKLYEQWGKPNRGFLVTAFLQMVIIIKHGHGRYPVVSIPVRNYLGYITGKCYNDTICLSPRIFCKFHDRGSCETECKLTLKT